MLDERHLLAAARYIERNPVRAKIAKKPTDYFWSSARSHSDLSYQDVLNVGLLFNYVEILPKEWQDFIGKGDDPDEVSHIRKYTMTGRPLGGDSFIHKLEKAFDKRLHALPVGRPKMKTAERNK